MHQGVPLGNERQRFFWPHLDNDRADFKESGALACKEDRGEAGGASAERKIASSPKSRHLCLQ